jgi:HlyD family secretion protein
MQEVVFKVVDGKALLAKVKSGLSDETSVAILEGIDEGDQVVTGPYRTVKKLEDGKAVREKKSGAGDKEEQGTEKEGEEAKDSSE